MTMEQQRKEAHEIAREIEMLLDVEFSGTFENVEHILTYYGGAK